MTPTGWLQLSALLLLLLEVRNTQGTNRRTDSEEELMKQFQIWEKTYKMGYHRKHTSGKLRFTTWKENLKYIQDYNQYESSRTGIVCMCTLHLSSSLSQTLTHTFASIFSVVKMNQFGDLTNREFQTLYTSLRQYNRTVTASMLDTAGDISRIRWGKEKILASKVPKRIDWREKGVVGPVNEITHCASGKHFPQPAQPCRCLVSLL